MKKILRRLYKKSEDILSHRGLDRYRIVKTSANFLKSQLKSDFVEIDGHKMFLDSLDSLRLSINGVYEEFETEIVKKIIKKGDVVVDVGANIGYYTLIFAKLVGNDGKVFSFEPEPTNFNLLKKNVEINGYKNVVLIKKAVSTKTDKTMLYIANDNKGSHTLVNAKHDGEFIEIDSVRLDDYFKNYYGKINFVKIDIEGSEASAIKGMSSLLRKMGQIKIMTEFSPFMLDKSDINSKIYIELLNELDFEIYNLDGKKRKIIPADVYYLLKRYTTKKENHANLLCIKKNQTIDKDLKVLLKSLSGKNNVV